MAGTQQGGMAVLAGEESPVFAAIAKRLRAAGWVVARDIDISARQGTITGLVYEPGLFGGEEFVRIGHVVDGLADLVDRLLPRLRSRANGGARIVVVASRDGLGWPDRPHTAAASAALVALARSLALQLGPQGITVNVVAGLPPHGSPLWHAGQPDGTHLREPEELLPEPVAVEDIARTCEFFVDDRSGYITGQVLHCCGGASLLSSLSV
jgi:NAD(P)-dependent dehydrogenase (short-subunit alcohol dehydrogenase family)